MQTEDQKVTSEVDVVKDSTRPKRKSKVLLDPCWFQETCKLAIKHKSNLIFTNKRVWGVSNAHGNSVWFEYPSNDLWCQTLSDMFSGSEGLPSFGVSSVGGNDLSPYAKIKLDGESKCYVDETTNVVHVLGAGGVKLKSGAFTASPYSEAPPLPDDIPEFVYLEDVVPKQIHELIVSCVSKDSNRPALNWVFLVELDGKKGIVGTDGCALTMYKPDCDLPEDFIYNPNIVDAKQIIGFKSVVDENTGNCRNHYSLDDGVLMTHVSGYKPTTQTGVGSVIEQSINGGSDGSVDGLSLKNFFSTVSSLGVGAKSVSKHLVFSKGKIDLVTEQGTMVSLDGDVELCEGKKVALDFTRKSLVTFANFGYSMNLSCERPSFYHDEKLTYLLMPLRVESKNNEQ